MRYHVCKLPSSDFNNVPLVLGQQVDCCLTAMQQWISRDIVALHDCTPSALNKMVNTPHNYVSAYFPYNVVTYGQYIYVCLAQVLATHGKHMQTRLIYAYLYTMLYSNEPSRHDLLYAMGLWAFNHQCDSCLGSAVRGVGEMDLPFTLDIADHPEKLYHLSMHGARYMVAPHDAPPPEDPAMFHWTHVTVMEHSYIKLSSGGDTIAFNLKRRQQPMIITATFYYGFRTGHVATWS